MWLAKNMYKLVISFLLSVFCLIYLQAKVKPKRVKAIYNCYADNPDELTFTEGEIIVVDGEEDHEWWVSGPVWDASTTL